MHLTLFDCSYWADGGTTILYAHDEEGCEHRIMLVQHAMPDPGDMRTGIPGRLYFDDELVPLRSLREMEVLDLLHTAEVRRGRRQPEGEQVPLSPSAFLTAGDDIKQELTSGPEEKLLATLAYILEFVKSERYLRFAERVEQAEDPTRYSIFAAWLPETRNQVAVRLGRILGIGVPAAQELLDKDAVLADDLSALEVAEIVKGSSAEGIPLRIEPPFRWLP